MQLWCEELKRYVHLVDDNLSIEADNQLQSLENYPSANSFDLEIVNEYWNIEIIEHNYYVILSNNGSPIMRGRLILQGTTPTTIKCVFQGMPYCKLFKKFEFKEKLSDYFEQYKTDDDGKPILMNLAEYFMNIKQNMFNFIPSKRGVFYNVPMYESNYWNYASAMFINLIEKEERERPVGTPIQGYLKKIKDSGGVKEWEYQDLAYGNSAHIIQTDKFLQGIGLNVKDEVGSIRPYIVAHKGVHVKMMIKVRLEPPYTPNNWQSKYSWNQSYSRIYLQALGKEEWDYDKPYVDATRMGFVNSFWQNGFNKHSKTPFKCKCVQYDLIYDDNQVEFAINEGQEFGINKEKDNPSYQYDTQVYGRRFEKFKLQEPIDYDRGDSIEVYLPTIENTPLGKAKYVDVHLLVDDVITVEDYALNIALLADTYVPFNSMLFLEQSTNQFLNELSLNSKYASFLRNPMFINNFNCEVLYDTPKNVFDKFILNENELISIERELDNKTPSDIVIKNENGFYSLRETKVLNGSGDKKELIQINTSSMIEFPLAKFNSIPFYWTMYGQVKDPTFKKYESQNLKCAFVQGSADLMKITKERKDYNWVSDSMKMDYVKNFQDHTNKYKVECVGYKLQEYVEYEGQMFVVAHFRTSDMVYFELEMYKVEE